MIKKRYAWIENGGYSRGYAAKGRITDYKTYSEMDKKDYSLVGFKFELINELLAQTYFYDEQRDLTFWISQKNPNDCLYVKQNFELIVTNYNEYWAKLNE